ncbi:MAG: glycosyltransferase family 2 protein [Bacteroidales bacterium]|jgi:glycosyltransferase involved in cell wall biosynthesis|nr:glycosyltransferase family 2 protein [Bacteroidales bacterium]
MKISAVIITGNEERNIGRCLASLQDVADDIVVVDSGSTDKTKEISEQYRTRFFSQEWLGYAGQKNYANSLAENDMILSLDADETLSGELKASILEIKRRDEQEKVAYSINRLNNFYGNWIRHSGIYPDVKIRLFNRKFAAWNNQKVHETIQLQEDTKIIYLKGYLLHYTCYTIEEYVAQINKFSSLAAEEYYEQGKKISYFGLIVRYLWRFNRDFIFRGGFLDGFAGYTVCKLNALATFLKYTKLKKLYKSISSN